MVSDALDGEITQRLSERIAIEARRGKGAGRGVLDIIGAPFWALGWVVFWVLVVLGGIGRWTWAGIRVGWLDARAQAQARRVDPQRWPVRPRRGAE